MPNTKSAAKAMRQSLKRRASNLVKKNQLKTAVKEVKKLALQGKKTESEQALKKAYAFLDKAAKTHVIHKNTAARKKSRLAKMIAKLK